MRHSELRRALTEEFGDARSQMIVRDHWLRDLSATAAEALASGIDAKTVWRAICEEFDIPEDRRHGRGIKTPPASGA